MKTTSFQYSLQWRSKCRRTYQLFPRCICNPFHKATAVHHIQYKRSFLRRILGLLLLHSPRRSLSGLEIPGWDIVPVCNYCHTNNYGRSLNKNSVHYVKVWKQLGGLNNHNTFLFAWKLRIKFWILAIFYNAIKVLFPSRK